MSEEEKDLYFMRIALDEAVRACEEGEVPVGAVVVRDGVVLGTAHNQRERSKDPTAHAEVLALRSAVEKSDSWRLLGTTLYVTKEPCIMCAGTMVNARLKRLVYGCSDPKAGAVDSLYQILQDTRLNHQVEVRSGVLGEECAALLRGFFEGMR